MTTVISWPRLARRGAALCGVIAALCCGGCYGATSAYVEADYPPVAIETYPHTYYEGRVVYLVGDRWYMRDGGGWYYYRSEPPVLYRYRAHYYPRPSYGYPARRYYGYGATRRAAPPARRAAPPARYVAPPAREVAPPAVRRR